MYLNKDILSIEAKQLTNKDRQTKTQQMNYFNEPLYTLLRKTERKEKRETYFQDVDYL